MSAAEATTRWATFDCYGTLVDWNAGIAAELARLFGAGSGDRLLARYHELEPAIQAEAPGATYREVMARALAACATSAGVELEERELDALGASLPSWPVFDEVPAALADLRRRGWRLAILSNTDRDLIDASMASIGVPFELAVVASEIRSYKPAPGHWEAFFEATGADRGRHVHVAASLFHDIEPAASLDVPCVWINRLAEQVTAPTAAVLGDLRELPNELDRIVPPPV